MKRKIDIEREITDTFEGCAEDKLFTRDDGSCHYTAWRDHDWYHSQRCGRQGMYRVALLELHEIL